MKLGVMPGDAIPAAQLREEGFAAIQLFFGSGADGAAQDLAAADVDATLRAGGLALAAMTLHVDLVGPRGHIEADVARAVACVEATAALAGRFGDDPRPILVWHPFAYPAGDGVEDAAVFGGLVRALTAVCAAAQEHGVDLAVEITRAGSVGSAETFLRLQDRVGSPALKVCLDAANFTLDRTPLERAVRVLGPHTVIAHGKDCRFHDDGTVADYGPTESGRLDYGTSLRCRRAFPRVPYSVLEYYRSRKDLLRARDIVRAAA